MNRVKTTASATGYPREGFKEGPFKPIHVIWYNYHWLYVKVSMELGLSLEIYDIFPLYQWFVLHAKL